MTIIRMFLEIVMSKVLANKILGKNLKRIRLSHGLTQDQTVAKLQVLGSPLSRSTYSLIEMGRGNIFVNDLVGLKTIFNVSYDEFFIDIPASRESRHSSNPESSQE